MSRADDPRGADRRRDLRGACRHEVDLESAARGAAMQLANPRSIRKWGRALGRLLLRFAASTAAPLDPLERRGKLTLLDRGRSGVRGKTRCGLPASSDGR